MRRFGSIVFVSALGIAAAAPLAAQVAGIPYYVNPRGGTGFSAAANLGITSSDDRAAKGKAYALTGGLGAGPLYLTGTAGTVNPDSGANFSVFGGTAGMKLFGGGLMPLAIGVQAGVGYSKVGNRTNLNIPIALGVGLNIPLFPLKPWVAPRFQMNRSSGGTGGSTNTSRVGLSAGVDFNMLLGLGVHAAFDYLPKKGSGTSLQPQQTTIGVGAHFNFRVPMM